MKRSEALKQITEIIIYGRTEFTSDKLAEIILTQLEAMGMALVECEGDELSCPGWDPE